MHLQSLYDLDLRQQQIARERKEDGIRIELNKRWKQVATDLIDRMPADFDLFTHALAWNVFEQDDSGGPFIDLLKETAAKSKIGQGADIRITAHNLPMHGFTDLQDLYAKIGLLAIAWSHTLRVIISPLPDPVTSQTQIHIGLFCV